MHATRRRADARPLRFIAAGIILFATAFWVLIGAYFAGRFDWEESLATMVIGVVLAVFWVALPTRGRGRR